MFDDRIPVAAIRRLTIHDGPGVRDTVFVKACPLHCIWCHNPECISRQEQLLFHEKLCSNCGECISVCVHNVHSFNKQQKHQLDRAKCINCGKCVEACLFNALELCGRAMSVEEVFDKVIKDRDFFSPEGGVTLSGGEPAVYPEFAAELFKKLHACNIHTALDTCGAVNFENYQKILPYTDLVLFDLKGMDPARHKQNTGMDNILIHENLKKISKSGTVIEIRMPIVPNCNDFPEDIEKTSLLLKEIETLVRVRLLAYHPWGSEKYAAAGMRNTMPQELSPDEKALQNIAQKLKSFLSEKISIVYN